MMSNNEYSKKDGAFIKACELANIPSTTRQASKYRNKRGLAYDQRGAAQKLFEEDQKSSGEEGDKDNG